MKILITGGTVSLGHKLVPHFLDQSYEVTVLSRCEDKQSRMKQEYPSVEFILGDIRDYNTCSKACKGQDIVIHAAALKRIEMGEEHPWEHVMTNIVGTQNMVESAKMRGVEQFVFISTDKACEPINVYGMCKAISERIVTKAGYNCVRYGNVNNSRGSVLPFWMDRRDSGKTIPVTNPNMTRFLIEFEEGIDLIELALNGEMNGDIYIPKLSAAKVRDMAELFGEVEVIGERPGEKLREVLINEDEFRNRVSEFPSYYVVHKEGKGNECNDKREEYSSENTQQLTDQALKKKLERFL